MVRLPALSRSRGSALVLLIAGLLTAGTAIDAARAQEPAKPANSDPGPKTAETAEDKARREADLKALEAAMAASAEARRKLEAEIAEIRTDRAKLNGSLIETAERERATEERIRAIEGRLQTLTSSES